MKVLIIDLSKCNGCYNCQIACKDEHVGNDWQPYARPQPDIGHFWIRVNERVRGSVPKVSITYTPTLCHHCDDAPCVTACPEKAVGKRQDGIVLIDPNKCKGKRLCIHSCPYGAIFFNRDLNIAQKCTFCAHLIDRGWKEPRCVDACPTGALVFGEEEELAPFMKQAKLLKPEPKTEPRVYYLGLQGNFVAGAVFDPETEECIEGAAVTLRDVQSEETLTTTTDIYGDFWIRDLKPSVFSLSITKEGYKPWNATSLNTEVDVHLGDIELHRK